MSAPRVIREYQTEAREAVERHWDDDTLPNRVGVVLPTGSGKSTVIADLAVRAYRRGQRVVMLAHRAELIAQMTDTIFEVDPTIPRREVGIMRGGWAGHRAPIVGATLQTLASAHRQKALGKRDIILWDEVHHAGAEGFHATFTDLGGYEHAKMCGFTATMRRSQQGRVGLGDVIEKVVYEKDLPWAIEQGFLVRPRGLTVRLDNLNALNDVRTVAGDFAQSEMQQVMEAASTYVVDAIKLHAHDRRPIIFAASVDAAHNIGDALNEADYPAVVITGEAGYEARLDHYADFRDGTARAMVTVMVLTEGADFPMCDTVVLARPTRSSNLYSQMVGRALRLWPGKTDALVMDLTGSARHMRLTNLSQILPGVETRVVGDDGAEIVEAETEPEDVREILRDVRERRRGPVQMVNFDLLTGRANDDTLWLETPAGVPFVSMTDNSGWLVFLWPDKGDRHCGRWAVATANTKRLDQGGFLHGVETYTTLAEAVEIAEAAIPAAGFELPRRTQRWHRDNTPPSDKQMNLARGLGIVEYADMTRGRLSDEISIVFAARRLDPAIKANTAANRPETIALPSGWTERQRELEA